MNHRAGLFAAIGALALAALTSCTAADTSRSSSASLAPKPSASRAVGAHPGWPFAIGCADVASLAEVRSFTTADASTTEDDSSPLRTLEDVAVRQGGALICDWTSATTRTNGVATAWLSVHVLPDATAAEEALIADQRVRGIDPSTPCVQGECWQSTMVAGNDVEIDWGSASHEQDPDGGAAAFRQVTSAVSGPLAHPGRRAPAWTAPSGPAPETFCDHGRGREQFFPDIASALGIDAGRVISAGGIGSQPGVLGAAVARSDYGECAWSTADDSPWTGIWILTGGSWALTEMHSATPSARDVADPAHPGAFASDDGHGNFAMTFASAGSLVRVDFSAEGATPDQAIERMAAVATALRL